jgi:hypothetical protein
MTSKMQQTLKNASTLEPVFRAGAQAESDAGTVAYNVARIMSAEGAPKAKDAVLEAKRLGYRAGQSEGYYSQVKGAWSWSKVTDEGTLLALFRTVGYYALYQARAKVPESGTVSESDVRRLVSESRQERTGGKRTGSKRTDGRKAKSTQDVADSQDANVTKVTVTLTGTVAESLATLVEASGMTAEEVLAGLIGDALTAYQAL